MDKFTKQLQSCKSNGEKSNPIFLSHYRKKLTTIAQFRYTNDILADCNLEYDNLFEY